VPGAGITLHVEEYGPADAPPVLFLHGLGWDRTLWQAMLPAFTGRYRVLVGDTRGHGLSDKPEGPYSISLFADDWDAAITALGLERPAVVGFSQGGMIAQELAARNPGRFACLVLAACAPRAAASGREKMLARVEAARRDGAAASARVAGQSIFHPDFLAARPEYFEAFVAWRAAMPLQPILDATTAGFGFDACDRLAAVTAPSLIIASTDDGLTEKPNVEMLHACLPGSGFVEIPGAGHMLPVEMPEAFAKAVLDHFAIHYPGAVSAPASH
jgi:pimeloyl-ACP methyl ester carboxylesterase